MGFFNKKKKSKKGGFQGIYSDDGHCSDNDNDDDNDNAFLQDYANAISNSNDSDDHEQPHLAMTTTATHSNSYSFDDPKHKHKHRSHPSNADTTDFDADTEIPLASMDALPSLIHTLSSCTTTYADAPARALRALFSLTEHHALSEIHRIRLIRECHGQLVPTLLQFVQRCGVNSSEQYLALLLLNNVSIPSENKRMVAVEYQAARILGRLLCRFPECSLMSIVLVNLCFCDSTLRSQLVSSSNSRSRAKSHEGWKGKAAAGQETGEEDICLVEAFAYALQVSVLPQGEAQAQAQAQGHTVAHKDQSPRELLQQLNLAAQKSSSPSFHNSARPFSPKIAHPETARWCLCGIKNLTRPSRDPVAAQALMDCGAGVLDLILRVLTVGSGSRRQASNDFHVFQSHEYRGINIDDTIVQNDPYTWGPNSMQDAALYILMNLALTPSARDYLRNDNVARRISVVARYSSSPVSSHIMNAANVEGAKGEQKQEQEQEEEIDGNEEDPLKEEKQKNLQCVKARMTLAYLFGSEGHFGQSTFPRTNSPSGSGNGQHGQRGFEVEGFEHEPQFNQSTDRPAPSTYAHQQEDLLMKGTEAQLLVELLANTLHGRGKAGAGGYNPSTFNAKKALYAIRCLLTNPLNVKTFFVTCGVKLNVLLLKSIALHSIQESVYIDLEAAEDACFSLYLLSNYGFMAPFLPPFEDGYPFENIIYAYSQKNTCTSAGKHAATQLLLREPFLDFDGNLEDDEPACVVGKDLELGEALFHAANHVEIFHSVVGDEPMDDIFGRPLMRCPRRKGRNGNTNGRKPWHSFDGDVEEDDENYEKFPSALDAVRGLSFGSTEYNNMGEQIDDIAIANNIAKCANGDIGGGVESYGFEWKWQDGGGGISERDVRKKLNDFRSGRIDSFRGLLKNVRSRERPSEPISIFGINCGCNSVVME